MNAVGDEKALGGFAGASDAVLINKGFVQDSVTPSQAFCGAPAVRRGFPVNNRRKTETKARMYHLNRNRISLRGQEVC